MAFAVIGYGFNDRHLDQQILDTGANSKIVLSSF